MDVLLEHGRPRQLRRRAAPAPYSIRTPKTKRYTVDNTIRRHGNLLVALVEPGLDAALTHLGTMGDYGYGWSDSEPIPEGYLTVKLTAPKGELARSSPSPPPCTRPTPGRSAS